MNVFLMHRNKDFRLTEADIPNAIALIQDLDLGKLLEAMANGDKFLLDAAKSALIAGVGSADAVLYRQRILTDCLEHSSVVREIYTIAVQAVEREKQVLGWTWMHSPSSTLHRAAKALTIFSELLRGLRQIALTEGAGFRSEGFRRFFDMVTAELAEPYMQTIDDHLARFQSDGMLVMTAALGSGNKGIDYILRKPAPDNRHWWEKAQEWLTAKSNSKLFYEIPDRDEAGFRALSDLRDAGIRGVAEALAQSSDHIRNFFVTLRLELAFYIGSINLHGHLIERNQPICLPEPMSSDQAMLFTRGLYDPSLSLRTATRVIGNDVDARGKTLIMITGANRGGKSTLLRSIGLAQLMMQAGMFVSAEVFQANLCVEVLTHFKREEDASMKSGKLDEELSRMTAIIDRISSNGLILLNESFASTNEREGSEIARQIVQGLLESGVKVAYVTHMYELSHGLHLTNALTALFLRAERRADGERTFRFDEAEPYPTSHGQDLYHRIFEEPGQVVT